MKNEIISQLETLNETLKSAYIEHEKIKTTKQNLRAAIINKYFGGLCDSFDITIRPSMNYFYFVSNIEAWGRTKEIVDVSIQERFWGDEKDEIQDVTISYYTTSIDNSNRDFELKRLELIGQIAGIISRQRLDILKDMNSIKIDTYPASSNVYKIEREISTLKENLKELELNELMELACDSEIKFSEWKKFYTGRGKYDYVHVWGFKIVRETPKRIVWVPLQTHSYWQDSKEIKELKLSKNEIQTEKDTFKSWVRGIKNIIA